MRCVVIGWQPLELGLQANTVGALESNIYKISLEPNTTLALVVQFRPTAPHNYSFQLPLRMLGASVCM